MAVHKHSILYGRSELWLQNDKYIAFYLNIINNEYINQLYKYYTDQQTQLI